MAEKIKSAQSAQKLRFFGLGKMKPFLKPHAAKFVVMVVFTLIVGGGPRALHRGLCGRARFKRRPRFHRVL